MEDDIEETPDLKTPENDNKFELDFEAQAEGAGWEKRDMLVFKCCGLAREAILEAEEKGVNISNYELLKEYRKHVILLAVWPRNTRKLHIPPELWRIIHSYI